MKKYLMALCLGVACSFNLVAANPSAKGMSLSYPQDYSQWQHSFFGGNGKTGIILFGDPVSERVIFTSRYFNFPNPVERTFAKVPRSTVDSISMLCAQNRFKEANDLAVSSSRWKDGGEGGRHPGFMMKIDIPQNGGIDNYSRTIDYSTGEIVVGWDDNSGRWERKGFVSRAQDVAVFNITHDGTPFDCAVSLSLPSEAHFPVGMGVSMNNPAKNVIGIDVSYPSPMDKEGFSGIVEAFTDGGLIKVVNDTLYAENSKCLTLIIKNGRFKDSGSDIKNLMSSLKKVSHRYASLFKEHRKIHEGIFNRVTIDLGADDYSRSLPNEKLLKMQKESSEPIPALWERLYYAGRYHFISSGNAVTPPDLLGIWTGDCKVGWGGYYHLDANLNLQVSSGNICDMPEIMEGYFNLNEVWAEDFERNANDLLGCRGMVACGNTPGLSSGLMASINDYYPYHYATGEEAWLLYPFWEHYQTTGDKKFLRDRLFPLLEKMGDFYEDFLRHKDAAGKYIFAGSVSPENQPSNLKVSLLNNSAFDVSGGRWVMSTLVEACDILGLYQEAGGKRDKWSKILSDLPDYRINPDGAISEWGWEGLEDQYHHRHSSHLMMVWPYHETSFSKDQVLFEASKKALGKRDLYNYENAGHGYLHAALIAAGVGDKESFKSKMDNLLRRDFFYDGLVSAHYPDFGVFCTDVCNSLPGLMTEMLVGSDDQGIYLLPVLVDGLSKGNISGVLTRCGVKIENLEWNRNTGKVVAILKSPTSKTVNISVGGCKPVKITLRASSYRFESSI